MNASSKNIPATQKSNQKVVNYKQQKSEGQIQAPYNFSTGKEDDQIALVMPVNGGFGDELERIKSTESESIDF